MCHSLLIKAPFQCWEQLVKFSRLNNWPISRASLYYLLDECKILPGDNVELATMKTGNEVGILLFLNYLLKLEREPETSLYHNEAEAYRTKYLLSRNFRLVGVDNVFDDDHQGRLEECGVCNRVQHCRAGLE